ncbi:hypothetical protein Droror1_Dr00011992, partial [Drosera rotundifolia]
MVLHHFQHADKTAFKDFEQVGFEASSGDAGSWSERHGFMTNLCIQMWRLSYGTPCLNWEMLETMNFPLLARPRAGLLAGYNEEQGLKTRLKEKCYS